ncbi:cytochrome P450 9e2 isoform X1 [Anabrus simplex]|uniref:cytochrome P450 9e2 isoform X1 n=1 Tax=Anabrus simplex TaxID=316456 RepID=UPI0035A29D9A
MEFSGFGWTDWTLGVLLLMLGLYTLGTWRFGHFKSRGVKYQKPLPFLGSMTRVAFNTQSFAYLIDNAYKEFPDEPFVGLFQFQTPVILVRDLELIKRITVKDFDHFTDHQLFGVPPDDFAAKNLFTLTGEEWREMRNTLSPAFTSSKMKAMFVLMDECGQQLGDYLQNEINQQKAGEPYVLDLKDLFTRYTNDVIATAAFGVHIDSLKEKDNEFYLMGKQITNFTGIKSLIFLASMFIPKILKLLGISIFSKQEKSFFLDLVHETISTREKQGIVRPDMIHLLMQARRGELKAEVGEEEVISHGGHKLRKINLTEKDITAQALIFFVAGFDTASSLLSFAGILMAVHEDVQRKLQEEIDEILGEDRQFSYEKVQKMKYLDMVISEALRFYPPAVITNRECTKDYTIPAGDKNPEYTIKKGEIVWIPVYGIQHDPKYYPNPEKFDPERFSEENKNNIVPYTYLPFGVGPRLCIGQRFALLEAKLALIHILSRFNLVVVKKTPLPLKLDHRSFVMGVEGGFWVGVQPRRQIST